MPFSYSLTESTINDKEKSIHFVDFLQKCQGETPNSKILLSAEQFYRHIYGHDYWGENTLPKDSDYWDLRAKYIKHISTTLSSFDVEILLFVRKKDSFIESLFKELRKTGRYSGEISEFIVNFSPMIDVERQIGLFQKYFQLVQIVNYEISKKSGLIKYFFDLISCPIPEGVDAIWENRTP